MNWYKFIVISSLIVFSAFHGFAQTDFCGIHNTSFANGEKLFFKVYYNVGFVWVSAGEATFNITGEKLKGRPVHHIVGDGKTLKSYDWFYRVRDRYETYIDEGSLLPLRFVRNVDEGGFIIKTDVSFNQATGKAVCDNNACYNIPRCVQDVLSTIYYARNIDYNKFKAGDKIPFSMFLDDQVYNLHIKYLGKEKVETRYGTFNAIKISPLLIDGTIFKGGDKMVVWVSDDANHIPLRVDSPILVGSIKVDMMGYERLRSPLSSLIKKK